ncbi:MAG: hypothetical protein ACREFK_02295 [Stellaceae bacterium]
MPPPQVSPRLDAAVTTARRQLATLRAHEDAEAQTEAASGGGDERAALLPRIRTLVAEVVRPWLITADASSRRSAHCGSARKYGGVAICRASLSNIIRA